VLSYDDKLPPYDTHGSAVRSVRRVGGRAGVRGRRVALWHLKITVNSDVSGAAVTPPAPAISAAASAEESYNPLVLEFDVNQNMEPMRDT